MVKVKETSSLGTFTVGGGSRIFQGREGGGGHWLVTWDCKINGACTQNAAI